MRHTVKNINAISKVENYFCDVFITYRVVQKIHPTLTAILTHYLKNVTIYFLDAIEFDLFGINCEKTNDIAFLRYR